MKKRQRATVIVELEGKILLTVDRKELVLLPGGGINRGELPISAAGRELYEETNLEAYCLKLLFQYESRSTVHHVFQACAKGNAYPKDDAMEIIFLDSDVGNSALNMSDATRAIIEKFNLIKSKMVTQA